MQREQLDQVRRLYRLLVCYERVEACADRLPAGERAVLVPALQDLGQVCWRQIFGATLEVAAHRRFVLEWCLRNVELLMKEEVLPVIAHQVITQHIQSTLAAIPDDGAPHEFGHAGPQGTIGTALRRVYLIQSLTILLARLALDGQIPARLQAHLSRHLVKRVRNLFAQVLGEGDAPDSAVLPDLAGLLCVFRDAGAITEEIAMRLHRVDAAAAALVPAAVPPPEEPPSDPTGASGAMGPVSSARLAALPPRPPTAPNALNSSVGFAKLTPSTAQSSVGNNTLSGVPRPEPIDAPAALVALAAAGELMRRLRRQSSLSSEDRDRLIKRVETEMDDMIKELGPRRLDRALAGLGEQLGIPVPPPRPEGLNSSGSIPIPKLAKPDAAPGPRTPDSSDFQWAFELIDDLRRDRPEGSSGK